MPNRTKLTTRFSGRVWRAGFLAQADNILSPARAPQGRWHHSGQTALYLSGSPEGCKVALNAYLKPDDPPRGIFPIAVTDALIIDLRTPKTRAALNASLDDIHTFWATLYGAGKSPPTWAISDKIRILGANGILTPSRSRPDLTHLTLFRWTDPGGATVAVDGPPIPFAAA